MSEQGIDIPGYTTVGPIGRGASAHVWEIQDADGVAYAAKVFDAPGAEHGAIEWEALRRYRGQHVVEAVDWILCPNGHRALITAYASGGNLEEVVEGRGGLTSGECVTALGPIAGALAAIHDDGFVHGDLTPRNILFDSRGKPLLADLGATRPIAQSGASEWGSMGFVAPEILEEESPSSAMDVYALGACAWFALVGEAPGTPVLRPHLRDVVPDVTPALAEFIHAALAVSPTARPTMAQAQEQIMGAAHSVVVPLSTALRSTEESTMTLRLRAEAAKKQRRAGSSSEPGKRRQPQTRGRDGHPSSHRIGGALLSGAALAALAVAVPVGEHHEGHKALGAVDLIRQGLSPDISRQTSAENAPLTVSDVERLLTCRANLWRDPAKADLPGCMAVGSAAFAAEDSSLSQAKNGHLRYEGLTFAVSGPVHIAATGPATEVASTTVLRSAYALHNAKGSVQVAARREKVAITFTRQKGQWRMANWKGA